MPKGCRRLGAWKERQSGSSCAQDFTVYEYANADSDKASGRVKKGMSSIMTGVKRNGGQTAEMLDSIAWYDKDISDFDIDDSDAEGEESERCEQDELRESTRRHRRKKTKALEKIDEGIEYPLDVWMNISKFIRPEDVGRFACICKTSHYVVHLAHFWIILYKRCFNSNADIPSELLPRYMHKIDGICGRVIRSLFYTYQPFIERIKRSLPFENQGDSLKGTTCAMMWYEKEKNHWIFYFKFRKFQVPVCHLLQSKTTHYPKKFSQFEPDINHNPEQQFQVLQVISRNFISIQPSIMGQILIGTLLQLSLGLKNHKLKLIFNPQRVGTEKSMLSTGTTVVIDPVLSVKVLDWWDPKYPYTSKSKNSSEF